MKRFKINFESPPGESQSPPPFITRNNNSPSVDTIVASVETYFGSERSGKRVAVWGLATPKVNTARLDSTTVDVIDRLIDAGLHVAVHDPIAMPLARTRLNDRVEFCQTQWHAASHSNAVIVAAPWKCYRYVDSGYYQWHASDMAIFDIPDCVELGSNLGGWVPHFAFGQNGLIDRRSVVRSPTDMSRPSRRTQRAVATTTAVAG